MILYYDLSFDNADGLERLTIEISDVYLGLQRIIEENSIESGLLVPTWCFFGTRKYEYADGTVEISDLKNAASPIMVINAIDGSIIDPVKGY